MKNLSGQGRDEKTKSQRQRKRMFCWNPNRGKTPLYCGRFGPRICVCWKIKKRNSMIVKIVNSQKPLPTNFNAKINQRLY